MVRSPERIVYNKLVRDKIPEIIEKEGKYPEISIIEDEKEYQKALAEKIIEEGKEYQKSKDVQELADILEIIEALLTLHKVSLDELYVIKNQKNKERGTFTKRIKLHSVVNNK